MSPLRKGIIGKSSIYFLKKFGRKNKKIDEKAIVYKLTSAFSGALGRFTIDVAGFVRFRLSDGTLFRTCYSLVEASTSGDFARNN